MIYVFSALVALVILIVVLLNISVILKVQYDNEKNLFRCKVHYLFLCWVISPEEEKKKKKKKKKSKKSEKKKTPEKSEKSAFARKLKDRGVGGFIEDIKDIVKGSWGVIVCVLRRSVLDKFTVHLTIAGEDAADTAVLYGYANAVIYPVVSAFLENVRSYKTMDVDISPEFTEGAEPYFEVDAVLRLKPVRFLGAVIESRDELKTLIDALNRK